MADLSPASKLVAHLCGVHEVDAGARRPGGRIARLLLDNREFVRVAESRAEGIGGTWRGEVVQFNAER